MSYQPGALAPGNHSLEKIPNIGAEENRQAVGKFFVNEKGFEKADIKRDEPIGMTIAGELYQSKTDLVVYVNGTRWLAIRCPAGSLGSWEREILAATRLTDETCQIPYAVADQPPGHTTRTDCASCH